MIFFYVMIRGGIFRRLFFLQNRRLYRRFFMFEGTLLTKFFNLLGVGMENLFRHSFGQNKSIFNHVIDGFFEGISLFLKS
jgi:hypothetical protein